MFNVGAGEIALIMVAALLVLGPKRLPELARGLGKFLREFRRQTDDVRSMVEREFYKMDQDLDAPVPPPSLPAEGLGHPHEGHGHADEEATVIDHPDEGPHPPGPAVPKLPHS